MNECFRIVQGLGFISIYRSFTQKHLHHFLWSHSSYIRLMRRHKKERKQQQKHWRVESFDETTLFPRALQPRLSRLFIAFWKSASAVVRDGSGGESEALTGVLFASKAYQWPCMCGPIGDSLRKKSILSGLCLNHFSFFLTLFISRHVLNHISFT